MSLKGFHIVFVTVSSLLCLFMALWAWLLAPDQGATTLVIGCVGALGLLVMPTYGVLFYRKITRSHI